MLVDEVRVVTAARLGRALQAIVRTPSFTLGLIWGASEGSEQRRIIYFTVVTVPAGCRGRIRERGVLKTTYWGLHGFGP